MYYFYFCNKSLARHSLKELCPQYNHFLGVSYKNRPNNKGFLRIIHGLFDKYL